MSLPVMIWLRSPRFLTGYKHVRVQKYLLSSFQKAHPALLVAEHEGGSVLELWKAIESQHLTKDTSLRHQAWTLLFAHRQGPDDDYIDYWRRGADITLMNLTGRQVINDQNEIQN